MIATSGAATHPGAVRSHNQDAFLHAAPVYLVADGMGGHESGERASRAAVQVFRELVGGKSLDLDQVRSALRRAQECVASLPADGPGPAAGTTLSGVAMAEVDGFGYWLAFNVGDSRTYRYSDGKLDQISVDHSVVQELLDAGELTAEQASTDRRRNIVTRALGAGSAGEADFWLFPAEVGDRIVICSDGLTGELPDAQIAQVLGEQHDPQRAAEQLTRAAVLAGGRDNITVVVVDAAEVATGAAGRPARYALEDTRPRVDAYVREP